MIALTLPTRNGSGAIAATETWLEQSVQQFFSTFNWEDHPPEVQEIKLTSLSLGEVDAPLSLSLTVGQFFSSINWDDTTIAAAPTLPSSSMPPTRDDLTLDDFSSLF